MQLASAKTFSLDVAGCDLNVLTSSVVMSFIIRVGWAGMGMMGVGLRVYTVKYINGYCKYLHVSTSSRSVVVCVFSRSRIPNNVWMGLEMINNPTTATNSSSLNTNKNGMTQEEEERREHVTQLLLKGMMN